jgi:SAM-dependent methyltransferase
MFSSYGPALARAHHLGFGHHADACAPAIVAVLQPIRQAGGLVLELGCGSGALTRRLLAAGLRVLATDASPAMLDLARMHAPGAEDYRPLVMPDDQVPEADAIVSVGHVLSYLSSEDAIDRALMGICGALRPDGVLAFDICDLKWGEIRRNDPPRAWVDDEWVLVTRFSTPAPNRFVRDITVFVPSPSGGWQRDDERHVNVLIDASQLPRRLKALGVNAVLGSSFGSYVLPAGLFSIIGRRSRDWGLGAGGSGLGKST